MTRLQRGDRSAFEPLFAALWPMIRDFVGRTLPPADAEDVAQQVLLDVFRRAGEFDPAREALPFVFGIAGWGVRTHRKKIARRREQSDEGLPEAPSGASLESQTIDRELVGAALEILGDLPDVDAETIRIAMTDGERPAVSPATFRKRLERALVRLRSGWRQKHETR